MKYTAKIKQPQTVGGIKIEPKGGELKGEAIKAILSDSWGKELIRKGYLSIEGVKPGDVDKPEKPVQVKKQPAIPNEPKEKEENSLPQEGSSAK